MAEILGSLTRPLRAMFAWRVMRDTGAVIYWQNDVTGERSYARTGGHQPIDEHWLRTGEWSPPSTPPSGPTGIFPRFEVEVAMPRPLNRTMIREALMRARSVLNTCAGDQPADLTHPARRRILDIRTAELSAAIDELDRLA